MTASQFTAFIDRVAADGENAAAITAGVKDQAVRAWLDVLAASGGRMPVPRACTGPDGQVFYSWYRGKHYLELEIIPDAPAEWFYSNRSGDYWGADQSDGDPLPPKVINAIGLFL